MKPTTRKINPADYYSVNELCELARVSNRTVWQWSSDKKFTTYKINGSLLFSAKEVNEHFENSERKSYRAIKQAA